MALRAGPHTFRSVAYDAPSDVLYAGLEALPQRASRVPTPEGHLLRFDEDGRFVGITLVEPRSQLEREGAVHLSLPSGDRVRVQGIELELRAGGR